MDHHRGDVLTVNGLTVEQLILADMDVCKYILDEHGNPSFEVYLNKLANGTEIYGGQIEIICLARMMHINIIVFQKTSQDNSCYTTSDNYSYHQDNAQKEIGIVFYPLNKHYDVLQNYSEVFRI
jgi:hypothetical protein